MLPKCQIAQQVAVIFLRLHFHLCPSENHLYKCEVHLVLGTEYGQFPGLLISLLVDLHLLSLLAGLFYNLF